MKGLTFFTCNKWKGYAKYCPHLPFTKVLLNAVASSIGSFIPYDWRILVKALLKPGEYLQWTVWFHDIARDHANKNARAGTPQNQITFEMLTGTGQSDAIEAQIQCPPFLHEQLKTVALEIKLLFKESLQVATLQYYKDLMKIMLFFS